MAFGTLLLEGNHVRITGQDVQRGTFAHRHCVIKEQNTGNDYCFLNNLNLGPQETFVARNSILAEYAVLGFELGYTYENPNALVIWEAQFGDFANTAQVMTDQFISAGEHKWLQQTGLVMLLPHGYMGQGAEHSSCRLERFLQLSDDDEDDIPGFENDFGRGQVQKQTGR
jgi:2-oxoglutarate dehydrogenase E1 component